MQTHLWTWNYTCYITLRIKTKTISRSVFSSQILQNAEINIVVHWKFWKKYGSVLHLFSCIRNSSMYLNYIGKFYANLLFHQTFLTGILHARNLDSRCILEAVCVIFNHPLWCRICFLQAQCALMMCQKWRDGAKTKP